MTFTCENSRGVSPAIPCEPGMKRSICLSPGGRGEAPRSWKALHPIRAVLVLAKHVFGDLAQVGAHGGFGSRGVTFAQGGDDAGVLLVVARSPSRG